MRQIFLTSMVILLLTGCSQVPKKLEGNKLMALNNFWDMIGGKKTPEEVKSESTKE